LKPRSLGVQLMTDMDRKKKKKPKMINITINLPQIYDDNIQNLIKKKIVPSRSEAIRIALREFLHDEYKNLKLLGFFEDSS